MCLRRLVCSKMHDMKSKNGGEETKEKLFCRWINEKGWIDVCYACEWDDQWLDHRMAANNMADLADTLVEVHPDILSMAK